MNVLHALKYSFTKRFFSFEIQPEGANLTARSPQWIGAWWLGYIVAGAVIFVNSVLILGFPRELPGSREMREKAIEEGHLPKKDNKLIGKLRDIIPATIQLLKNPVFMFNTMAVTAASLFGGAVGAFIAKFAQLKFGVNPGLAGITLGAVFLVGASGTLLNYLDFLYPPRKLTSSV